MSVYREFKILVYTFREEFPEKAIRQSRSTPFVIAIHYPPRISDANDKFWTRVMTVRGPIVMVHSPRSLGSSLCRTASKSDHLANFCCRGCYAYNERGGYDFKGEIMAISAKS